MGSAAVRFGTAAPPALPVAGAAPPWAWSTFAETARADQRTKYCRTVTEGLIALSPSLCRTTNLWALDHELPANRWWGRPARAEPAGDWTPIQKASRTASPWRL